MKKLFAIFFICIVIYSCKKTSTVNSSIVGTWQALPSQYESYSNGVLVSTKTDQPYASDYFDFKSNGEYQSLFRGNQEIMHYEIINDSIRFGTGTNVNTGKIKILTANNFSYFFMNQVSSTNYTIVTFSMQR